MYRVFIVLVFALNSTACCCQILESRNSLLAELVDDIKLKQDQYQQIKINGSLLWDTSEYVVKKFLMPFDTTDQRDIAVHSTSTRKRIVRLSKELTVDDYRSFKEQIEEQKAKPLDLNLDLKGSKRSKEKMMVSFSQPLVTMNRNLAIIKVYIKHSDGGFSRYTTVYKNVNGKWKKWDDLEREELAY